MGLIWPMGHMGPMCQKPLMKPVLLNGTPECLFGEWEVWEYCEAWEYWDGKLKVKPVPLNGTPETLF